MPLKKIGLALSGGGFRAAVYHMGVLARLAEQDLVEEVSAVSTVSGGSLGMGLVLAMNGFRWPTSVEYAKTVVPQARGHIINQDLESALIYRLFQAIISFNWSTLLSRAPDLSRLLRERWHITPALSGLPDRPQWIINATCYESGEDWLYGKNCAGDRRVGYTHDTGKLMLSDALAASSGFPGLLGAMPFPTKQLKWVDHCRHHRDLLTMQLRESGDKIDPKKFGALHLWDGGVYDNNGLNVFHNFDSERWERGVEFLIVSDATGGVTTEAYEIGLKAIFRIVIGVMMAQVRLLHLRAVIALMRRRHSRAPGVYLPIDHTAKDVLPAKRFRPEIIQQITADCLPPKIVFKTKDLQTQVRRLKPREFYTLFRHGFEVADYALLAYDRREFKHIRFVDSQWKDIVKEK